MIDTQKLGVSARFGIDFLSRKDGITQTLMVAVEQLGNQCLMIEMGRVVQAQTAWGKGGDGSLVFRLSAPRRGS